MNDFFSAGSAPPRAKSLSDSPHRSSQAIMEEIPRGDAEGAEILERIERGCYE